MINLIISSYDQQNESRFSTTEFDYVNGFLYSDLARLDDSKSDIENIRIVFILD